RFRTTRLLKHKSRLSLSIGRKPTFILISSSSYLLVHDLDSFLFHFRLYHTLIELQYLQHPLPFQWECRLRIQTSFLLLPLAQTFVLLTILFLLDLPFHNNVLYYLLLHCLLYGFLYSLLFYLFILILLSSYFFFYKFVTYPLHLKVTLLHDLFLYYHNQQVLTKGPIRL